MPPDLLELLHPAGEAVVLHGHERLIVLTESVDESVARFSSQLLEAGFAKVEARFQIDLARFSSSDGFEVRFYAADKLADGKALLVIDVTDHPVAAPDDRPQFGRD